MKICYLFINMDSYIYFTFVAVVNIEATRNAVDKFIAGGPFTG